VGTQPTAPASTPTSLIGRTLGRFVIMERLGKGGSGEVFRAQQVQLGRSAVIKVLRREVATAPNRVERFLREAKLASRLDHPYAAHIYAFGVEPDSVLWIAMEHVKGMTLDELVARRGPMPPSVFAPLFARLCEVVHSAHELGIVHRDIKGANVMVIERAGQLLPKLLDFGIAKSDGEDVTPGVNDGELTGHGVTLGSPHYMSPEQWERPSEVDARADIYALGVLAYRCVAGNLPFHTLDRNQLSNAHTKQPVPPLPDFVPAPLAAAVMRALAKQPAERWQTAVELAEVIQRVSGAPAVEAVPIFDPAVRDAWLGAGPQPIADAVAHLTSATTTVEADAALRELIAITCRWLAVLALSGLPESNDPQVREQARAVVGRDDGSPWLALARAAAAASKQPLPALVGALAASQPLTTLADRLDDRDRARTAAVLAADVAAAAEALRALDALLAYQLVVGSETAAESWQGPRRRERERVLVWGEPLADREVALLDDTGQVVARLSPFAQVIAPLPAAEPELFLLWRSGRGAARLMAAPWGFERDDDAAGMKLAALSTEDSDTAADPADDRSPYPGLASYSVADADHFVGREREVESLANRLVRAPLLAVLGPSGVGKSSFIHAGLVPRLDEHHRILTMRPGRHPMHALAALPQVSGDSEDAAALVSRLRELGESAQRGLVLVIDQLEELVTLCADAKERAKFAETLAAAADGPGAPVRVVATLRDDFATIIESEPAFRGRFEVFVLATPPPEALRRIVIEPARRAAVTVDPQVVDDMVAEVAGRPASLPLLSFTAAQLWQTRDRSARKITHDAYLELGGVAGALATYADQVYASLARRDQDTVRDLFARLVAADGTRIPSPRAELEQLPGARGVLAHLVDARLLVVRDDDGRDAVEIVHECLAERWPRLARWRSEDAADRALLGDVRAAARRWNESGRRPDLLWRGQALSELTRLVARSTALTELERAFAFESKHAQQRARRVRRSIVAGVMVLLASAASVMAYLSVVANRNRADAERNATAAKQSADLADDRLTESLIAQGRRELNDDRPMPALAYFAAAMRRGADSSGLRAMVSIASRGWKDILATHRGPVSMLSASAKGWIVAGGHDGMMRFWSERGELIAEIKTEVGAIAMVDVLADDTVLCVGQHGTVHFGTKREILRRIPTKHAWYARFGPGADELTTIGDGALVVYGFDGVERRRLPLDASAQGVEPIFDPTTHFAILNLDSNLFVLDLTTMKQKRIAQNSWGPASGSRRGTTYAYVDRDRRVHLIDITGKLIKTIDVDARPNSLKFSEDGSQLAVVGDTELQIYDTTGKRISEVTIERDQSLFLLRDDHVWVGGDQGMIRHYKRGDLVSSLPAHVTEIQAAVLGGDALALLGGDGTLVLVRASSEQFKADKEVCPRPSYGSYGIATSYECEGNVKLLLGRELLGEYPSSDHELSVSYHAATQRAAISGGDGVYVFERTKRIAKTEKSGATAFEDADHVLIAEPGQGLWRWTFATNGWEKVYGAVGNVYAVATLPGKIVFGNEGGDLVVLEGSREPKHIPIGEQIGDIQVSADHRWLAVNLATGATTIVDTQTWQVARKLAPADNFGSTPTFDASGDLLLRSSRNALTIWDRATGEELVFGLDLLQGLANGRFLPDGRIELNRREPGLLDIPRDTRPISQILADIDCKVPLKVVGSRIEPQQPSCP
jgi:tRNA A-37 threonylcarbamoyl transferase component Bud32/WD40 repeat protein